MTWFNPRSKADWMQTFSGVCYYPASPRVEDVRIIDIAHHLSMLCRYTGACRRFYSVAEHSVLVSQCVPPALALAGLLHDAPEAYLNDLSRPLKRSLPDYRRLEALNWAVIADKFGLPPVLPRNIHIADVAVLLAEQAALMPPLLQSQGIESEAADVEIQCWSPAEAEERFMYRFYELTRGTGHAVMCEYHDPVVRLTLEGCAVT